jgi:hypothetical protein
MLLLIAMSGILSWTIVNASPFIWTLSNPNFIDATLKKKSSAIGVDSATPVDHLCSSLFVL